MYIYVCKHQKVIKYYLHLEEVDEMAREVNNSDWWAKRSTQVLKHWSHEPRKAGFSRG